MKQVRRSIIDKNKSRKPKPKILLLLRTNLYFLIPCLKAMPGILTVEVVSHTYFEYPDFCV